MSMDLTNMYLAWNMIILSLEAILGVSTRAERHTNASRQFPLEVTEDSLAIL
jgi:hypothetical protein